MELLERMFAASSASAQLEDDRAAAAIWKLEILWWQAQLEGDRATTAIWELEIFWEQAQLEGDKATTAIWELEIFGGRPCWKATGLQLQPGNPRFLGAGPVGRRHGYNCNLGTRDFWWQAQLEGNRATTAIWELEIFWWQAELKGERLQLQSGNPRFLVAGPVGRRQGYNCNLGTRDFLVAGPVKRRKGYKCNLGTRDFWGQAQLEGDTATTAIWEPEIFGGRPSWKAKGLQLQSGNSRFFGGRPS